MRHVAGARYRAGFSLVELLVVLGIIVLVIGIILPVVSTAREKSRKTVCQSNLRVIGQCLIMYANANNGRLPNGNPPGEWNNYPGTNAVMVAFARDYVKAAGVFACPSDSDPPPEKISTADQTLPESARMSYEFFSVYWAPEYGPMLVKMQGQKQGRSMAPLAWDVDGGEAKSPLKNHKGGGNVVFCDAHVEWQEAKFWDQPNMPDPANEYWPIP
jgi:prepilin-type processing-associated H-X9-DG protein/prepilin-type N-terminal cleavage/methylation domain-containing protein